MNNSFFLILPDIRSCHNVGAMFRTADAFGVSKIFLTGYTPAPPKPQIDKVSLGAEKWVSFKKYKHTKLLVNRLKKQGVKIYALEFSENSRDISLVDFKSPLALIVGNEVEGVSSEILALCDGVVHIPMYGKKESLNVSIAAGVALYEIKNKLYRKDR